MDLTKVLKNSFNSLTSTDIVLMILLIIFSVYDVDIPMTIASLIKNNIFVEVGLHIFALSVFLKYNYVFGLTLMVATNILIYRSKHNGIAKHRYLPSESNKQNELSNLNETDSITLEEEVINSMAPIVTNGPSGSPSYLPILDNDAGASLIDV